MTQQDERLLTVADVAKLLQIHQKTVYDLTYRGILPSIRIGGAVRFSLDDIWTALRSSGATEPVASGADAQNGR